jgi:putative aldouronate transport system substrate-binding protein
MHSGKRILCSALAVATIVPMAFMGSSSVVASAAAATVTLKVYTGGAASQGVTRVQDAVNAYLKKKNTGIQIQWTTDGDWGAYGTKINNILTTNQDFDVINTSSWNGAGYVLHAQNGQLTNLTPYITSKAYASTLSIIGKDFLNGTKVNGKYYGLPTNKEKAHNFGFLVQTKELKKLKINTAKIKSLADLAKYFPQVIKDGYTPLCSAAMDSVFKFLDWDQFDSDSSTFAFDPSNEKTVVNPFTAAKTVTFYNLMKTYHAKGYFSSDVLTSSGEESDMKTGKYFCGSWSLMPGKASTESTSLKLGLTQIDITPVEKTNRETLGCLTAIPKGSKHPAQAFKFMSMLYTDKTLINLMTYGVAKTDYTLVSSNTIKVNSSSNFTSAGGWILGNEFNNYLTTTQSKTLWTDIAAYNKKAKVLTDLGFIFDSSKYKTQYTNTKTIVNKYYPQLFFGTTSNVATTVAAFKKELNNAGQATLLKAVQTQYNTWLKKK